MPTSKSVASTGPPIRALVIDNDAAHAETVADSLTRVGYECTVASTGTEGAALLEKGTFEIVITDLKMPDVGGLEILGVCKEKLPDAEVIWSRAMARCSRRSKRCSRVRLTIY